MRVAITTTLIILAMLTSGCGGGGGGGTALHQAHWLSLPMAKSQFLAVLVLFPRELRCRFNQNKQHSFLPLPAVPLL